MPNSLTVHYKIKMQIICLAADAGLSDSHVKKGYTFFHSAMSSIQERPELSLSKRVTACSM